MIQDLSRKDLETFKNLTEHLHTAPESERMSKVVSAFVEIYKDSHELRVKIQSLQNYLLDQKFHNQYVTAYSEMIEKSLPTKPGRNNSKIAFVIVNCILGFLNNTLENAKNITSDTDLHQELTRMIQAYVA